MYRWPHGLHQATSLATARVFCNQPQPKIGLKNGKKGGTHWNFLILMTTFSILFFFLFSALFLVEAGNEKLWLWQGWWPDVGHEANDTNMSTGSGIIRWHAERREAMRTVKEFQRSKFSKLTNQARPPMELVWAGHEPLEFTNLFPSWTHHIDIQTLNYKVSTAKIPLTSFSQCF